jgi:galactonate dehydratase
MMETLRDAVGENVDIMVDFHGRPASIAAALQYIEELAPYKPMFCEEPVIPGDTEALRMVTERAGCPIASGERLVGYKEFEPIFQQKAVHILQPDLNHTGGILEGKRIAAAAEQAFMGVAPHNPNGPIAGAAALHYDVSTPNFVIQEEMSGAVPWYDEVVTTPMKRIGSSWEVPLAPGLGVEVNEAEAAKHPFKPEVMHTLGAVLSDGTVVDW